MARFEPFPALRYDPIRVATKDVVAPPYDVVGPDERRRLASLSPYNVAHVDLPPATPDDAHYTAAAQRFNAWVTEGVLAEDPEPGFYVYAMGYRDKAGIPRQTAGVIGALSLSPDDGAPILPHERTHAGAKDDRLKLLRATRANLSPIWGLSLARGLSELCQTDGPPVARCTDDDGVHHRLWPVTAAGRVRAIAEAVASAPVVIADGHHRYETARTYREERGRQRGGAAGDDDLLMAYVVELVPEQVAVRPIHRLFSGLPPGFDMLDALAPFFDVDEAGATSNGLSAQMTQAGALGLVVPEGGYLLRPRDGADADEVDAERLDSVLASLPPHELAYDPDAGHVGALVEAGKAQAGLLLRPVTVDQIADAAREGRRMPQKTTFFWPKPRTGLLFRRLRD